MGSYSVIEAKSPEKVNAQNQECVDKELFLNVIIDGSGSCQPQKIMRDAYRNGREIRVDNSKQFVISFSGNENPDIPQSSNANVENELVVHETLRIDMVPDESYANKVCRIRNEIRGSVEKYYEDSKINSLKVHLFLFFYKQGDPAVNLMNSLAPVNEEDAKKKIKNIFKKPIFRNRKIKYQGIEYIGCFDPVNDELDNTTNRLVDRNVPSASDVLDAAVMCQFTYDTQSEANSSIVDFVISKVKSLFSAKKRQTKTADDDILNDANVDIGWKMMTEKEVAILTDYDKNFKLKSGLSGFFSQLFYKSEPMIGNIGSVKYAYCTAGTNVTSFADWFSNISQGLIGWAPQYVQSVRNAKILDKHLDKNTLYFIGHSLGGGLASNNALVTNYRHAVTFNAAGLNILRVNATLLINNRGDLFKIRERRARIHPYIIRGEILHSILGLIGQMPYGYDKEHSFVNDDTTIIEKIRTTIDRHGLEGFIKGVKFKETLYSNQYLS